MFVPSPTQWVKPPGCFGLLFELSHVGRESPGNSCSKQTLLGCHITHTWELPKVFGQHLEYSGRPRGSDGTHSSWNGWNSTSPWWGFWLWRSGGCSRECWGLWSSLCSREQLWDQQGLSPTAAGVPPGTWGIWVGRE